MLFVMTSLSPQTKHTINKEVLGCMKSKAVLVNTARGPVVDTDALVQALREGKLGAAGLDVVEGEPSKYTSLSLDLRTWLLLTSAPVFHRACRHPGGSPTPVRSLERQSGDAPTHRKRNDRNKGRDEYVDGPELVFCARSR